jgi:peroxiredoxin
VAQLRHQREALEALNTRVLVIAFVTDTRADEWLTTTRTPFPLLLDDGREVYAAYGLKRSLLRAYSPRTLLYYARQLLKGERLHLGQGDTHQLGGDFVIDKHGIVRLAYRSADPTDRPELDDLLTLLRGLEAGA